MCDLMVNRKVHGPEIAPLQGPRIAPPPRPGPHSFQLAVPCSSISRSPPWPHPLRPGPGSLRSSLSTCSSFSFFLFFLSTHSPDDVQVLSGTSSALDSPGLPGWSVVLSPVSWLSRGSLVRSGFCLWSPRPSCLVLCLLESFHPPLTELPPPADKTAVLLDPSRLSNFAFTLSTLSSLPAAF